MAGVGEVEALVAERKIGDAIFAHGQGQTLPVVEGRILYLHVRNPAVFIGENDMGDFTAMTRDQSDGERVWGEALQRSLGLRRGKIVELLEKELSGGANLQRAKLGSRIDIAGVERGRRNRG